MAQSNDRAFVTQTKTDEAIDLDLVIRVVGISAGAVVAYGLSRFSYALLLPAMRSDLQLDYSSVGGLGTANNVGYLVGAVMAARTVTPDRARSALLLGLVLTAAFLAAMAVSHDYWMLFAFRLLGGIPAAFALVSGGLIVTYLGGSGKAPSALALNIYYCGGGLGIFLSTFAALPILGSKNVAEWPLCWLLLGTLAFATVLPAYLSTRGFAARTANARSGTGSAALGLPIIFVGLTYFCFGVGHAGYITFIVASVQMGSAGPSHILLFWAAMGLVAIVGGLVWTRFFSKLGEMLALASVMLVIAVGSLVPVHFLSTGATILSAILFGSSFLSVVAAVNYATRAFMPVESWAATIAMMTVIVGSGQIIGPVLTGWLADMIGLNNGLALSPASLFVGSAIAFIGSVICARRQT